MQASKRNPATPNATDPCLFLPRDTSFPIDGFGGSYYMIQFPVPTYSNKVDAIIGTISWADIDAFTHVSASNAIASAVGFGICAVTLLNVIVLTPQPKRKLPLHRFLCLALTFQTLRHILEMVIMTSFLQASSYYYLTRDADNIQISRTCYILTVTIQVVAPTAFVLVQVCFYIQGRGLMTWLRIHQRIAYYTVLFYLVSCGVIATCCRIGVAVMQIIDPWGFWASWRLDISRAFNFFIRGTFVTTELSIGSWSLVFLVSAISVIVNRRQILLVGNSVYDIALNIIAVFGLHSFIIPIIFCFLKLLPFNCGVNQSDGLILTSVLFPLPLGSMFSSVNGNIPVQPMVAPALNPSGNSKPSSQEVSTKTGGQLPLVQIDDMPLSSKARTASPTMLSELPTLPLPTTQPAKRAADPFEVELALIDGIDIHDDKT